MKILWVSHSSELAGAERCLIEAVKGLHEKGVEIELVMPESGQMIGEIADYATVHIIKHYLWADMRKRSTNVYREMKKHLKPALKIYRLIRQLKPDLIVSNTLVIPSGALAAKFAGVPHIWYIHEFVEEDHGLKFLLGRKFSLWFVDKFSRKIIVNSQAVFDRFNGEIPEKKLSLVYYAVEPLSEVFVDEIVEKKKDTFYLALIGRKSKGKGQEDAVRALALLRDKRINAHLWLIGGNVGNYETELKKLAHELNVEQNIDFIPFVNNPLSFTKVADVALVTSRCEAFGRVTIEAMKLGKPVICSTGGANRELIKEYWNGLTYQTGNAQSLAEKIEMMFKDLTLLKTIGTNAQQWSLCNFNYDKYAESLIKVFENQLKNE